MVHNAAEAAEAGYQMSRLYLSDDEFNDVVLPIIRSSPRNDWDGARAAVAKAFGLSALTDAQVRGWFVKRGLGNPGSYLGKGGVSQTDRVVTSAQPIEFARSRRAAIPPPAKPLWDTEDGFRSPTLPRVSIEPPEHLSASSGDSGLGDERLRVVVPDSHGCYIDPKAATAFLADLKVIDPDEIVFLGDHVDVSGMYSVHQPSYLDEFEYSYETDIMSAEAFFNAIQKRAPRARGYYLEGNHEAHVERWISRTLKNSKDARAMLELQAPEQRLRLKERGIQYCRTLDFRDGLSVPGTIKLGKCHFTHGFTAAKYTSALHVARYGSNIVHGHVHRVQEYGTRTVASDAIGGWCPGTLALLQPYYRHTSPTEWRHGYGLQAVSRDGRFVHINVPLVNGWSGLNTLLKLMRPKAYSGEAA